MQSLLGSVLILILTVCTTVRARCTTTTALTRSALRTVVAALRTVAANLRFVTLAAALVGVHIAVDRLRGQGGDTLRGPPTLRDLVKTDPLASGCRRSRPGR